MHQSDRPSLEDNNPAETSVQTNPLADWADHWLVHGKTPARDGKVMDSVTDENRNGDKSQRCDSKIKNPSPTGKEESKGVVVHNHLNIK